MDKECECKDCVKLGVKMGVKIREFNCKYAHKQQDDFIRSLIEIDVPCIDIVYYDQEFEAELSEDEALEMYNSPNYINHILEYKDGDPIKYVQLELSNRSGYFKGEYHHFLLDPKTDIKVNIDVDELEDGDTITIYERICLYPGTNYVLARSQYYKSSDTYERIIYLVPERLLENSVYRYGEEEYVDPNRFGKTKSARK